MIHLRVLGSLSLEADPPSEDVESLLAQSKPVALLTYLATARAGHMVRRDTLLGMFWPESDQRRARHSLRQALYVLRPVLGDALVRRGDQGIGVDPDVVWSDVRAFRDAVGGGRLEEALELYRGDLLEGFFLSGSPGFEDWLETERAELRALAARSAWRLVDDRESEGRLVDAVEWARRGLDLEGRRESGVRRLITLLAKSHQRGEAIRVYEDFVRYLDDEYGIEPSPETTAISDALRDGSFVVEPPEPGPAEPPAVHPVGTESDPDRIVVDARVAAAESVAAPESESAGAPAILSAPSHASPKDATPRRGPSFSRVLVAMAVIGGLAFAGSFLWRQSSTPAESGELTVAIPTFGFEGVDRMRGLSTGVASMVAQRIGRTEILEVVELDRVGARGVRIDGSLRAGDDDVYLTARILAADGTEIGSAVASGTEADFPRVVDELALGILRVIVTLDWPGLREAWIRHAAAGTDSATALIRYLRGEMNLAAGRYYSAETNFERATELDSSFAVAWYALSLARMYTPRLEGAREAALQAVRNASALDAYQRGVMEAHLSRLEGRLDEAERRLASLLVEHPGDPEVTQQMGELLFFGNPQRGRSITEAAPWFDAVTTPNEPNVRARHALVMIGAVEGNDADVARRAREFHANYDRVGAAQVRDEIDLVATVVQGGRLARNAVIETYEDDGFSKVSSGLSALLRYGRDLEAADLLTETLRRSADPRTRLYAWITRAYVVAARGASWTDVAEPLDSASVLSERTARLHRALLATLPGTRASDEVRRDLADDLARPASPDADGLVVDEYPAGDMLDRVTEEPVAIDYLLGVLALSVSDMDGARAAVGRLAAHEQGEPGLVLLLTRSLRARIFAAEGRTSEAIALLSQTSTRPWGAAIAFGSPFYEGAADRYLLGSLLRESGRPQEADRWIASAAHGSPFNVVFDAPPD